MSKIRVLRIQSRICIGGPALNTIFLSGRLNPERYQTILIGGRLEPNERSMEPLALAEGVPIHIIEEMGRSIRWSDDIKALWRLIKLIRHFRPHIVHTHTAKAGAIGRIAAFLCRVPVRIHTFHGHVFHGYFNRLKTSMFLWFERFLAMISHGIVAISPCQKQDLTEKYKVVSTNKCSVVRLGFELTKLINGQRGRFRQRLGCGEQTRLIAILARLVPIKNHQLLLRAIGHWHRQHPQASPESVQFLIIGDGELKPELQELGKSLGIDAYLQFTGWLKDVSEIYADIDLNVLVSKNEGTPVSLIEGLACGVPILTTDVGGIRDFADEAMGAIVPPDIEPEDLAVHLGQAIERLEQQGRLSEPDRQRILKTYDVSRLVGDMDQLYQRFLPGKG